MNRNPKAPLSPHEMAALRALRHNPKPDVPPTHRKLLLSMGLAIEDGEGLKLSDAGHLRLQLEERDQR